MSAPVVHEAPPALDHLMADPRRRVSAALVVLLGIALVLWLARGPRPLWTNVPFLAVSVLLTPVGYAAAYGMFLLWWRTGGAEAQTIHRAACAIAFFAGAGWLALSTVRSVHQFLTHRPVIGANFIALGLALGALNAWALPSSRHRVP